MTCKVVVTLSVIALAVLGGGYGTETAYAASDKQAAISVQLKRYYHSDGYIKAIGHVARRTIYNPNLNKRHIWKQALRWLTSIREDARNQLRRLRQPDRPVHYLGWICIHSKEAAWNANTGNGFYGGLQAHLDWYGVHRMDLLSPIEQIRHAEGVAAQYSFSYKFMQGQWPNTFPRCSGYF